MSTATIRRYFIITLALVLCLLSVNAVAMPATAHEKLASSLMGQFPNGDVPTIIFKAASYLFWSLATISLVWSMATILLRRADFGELFLELVRFIIFTGLFYWLLKEAGTSGGFIYDIFDSFKEMAGASGAHGGLDVAADSLINIGLNIFYRVIDQVQNAEAEDTLVSAGMALFILAALTLVTAQMVLVVIMAWMLAYGGIFLLGFGGSRWTSLIAINYYKHAVAVGIALFALFTLMHFGFIFLKQIADPVMEAGEGLHYIELADMFVVALLMAVLGVKLPGLFYTLVTGSQLGLLAGTASMAGTAIITGGSGAVAAAGNAMAQHSATRRENHYETAVDAFRNVSPDLQRGDTLYQSMNMAGYGSMASGQAQSRSESSVFGGPPPVSAWASSTPGQQAAPQGQASMHASPSSSPIAKSGVTAAQGSSNGRQEMLQDAPLAATQKRSASVSAQKEGIGLVTDQLDHPSRSLDTQSVAHAAIQAISSEHTSSGGFQPAALTQNRSASVSGQEEGIGQKTGHADPSRPLDTHSVAQAASQAISSENAPSGGFQPDALQPSTISTSGGVEQSEQMATKLEAASTSRTADRGNASFTGQQQTSFGAETVQQLGMAASGVALDASSSPSGGFQSAVLAPPATPHEGTPVPAPSFSAPESSTQDVEQTVTRHIKTKVVDQREPTIDPAMKGSNHRANGQAAAADPDDEVAAFRDRHLSSPEGEEGKP
jgi:type IV secretion system protein VirB6/type IV secretion system protein TrbL